MTRALAKRASCSGSPMTHSHQHLSRPLVRKFEFFVLSGKSVSVSRNCNPLFNVKQCLDIGNVMIWKKETWVLLNWKVFQWRLVIFAKKFIRVCLTRQYVLCVDIYTIQKCRHSVCIHVWCDWIIQVHQWKLVRVLLI